MGVLNFLRIARPIYISYHFVITHMGVDHLMWTRCEQFTHIYIQTTQVRMKTHARPKSAHGCDTHDTRVALNLWVICTVHKSV